MNWKRLQGITLAIVMVISSITYYPLQKEEVAQAATSGYGLASNIQDGVILHCFDWKYNDIKAELPNIAAAGFTSIQTSPAQRGMNSGTWYWLYQPLGFSIQTNDLGTKEELRSLCNEAHKYGIKVIVDVVANHLAGSHANIQEDLKPAQYWHTWGGNINYQIRSQVINGDIGMQDIKSEDAYVQQCVRNYVNELISVGIDGIRWDAAKHIGLPSENCDFWPAVTNNTGIYHYAEILTGPDDRTSGNEALMKEYTDYASVTDSDYGNNVREAFNSGNLSRINEHNNEYWINRGISANKLVYWGESHDNYSNNGEYGWGSQNMSQNVVDRAYAVVAARANSSALYFSRPSANVKDQIKAGVKGSTHFTSSEVAAVNHFHNAMIGQSEAFTVSNNCAVVSREQGAVVVKGSGSGYVSVSNASGKTAPGTYKDEITGNTFTVTSSTISGTIGDSGIAVIYDADNIEIPTYQEVTTTQNQNTSNRVYLSLPSGWSTPVYCYVYQTYGDANANWPGVQMSYDSTTGYYYYDIPEWITDAHIMFTDNKGNQYPGAGQAGLTRTESGPYIYKNGQWSKYVEQMPTQAPTQQPATEQTATEQQTVQEHSDPYDLQVLAISYPQSIKKGDNVTFTALVCNNTSLEIPAGAQLRFKIDDEIISTKTLSEMGKNGYLRVNATWTAVSGGHTVEITVDPDNLLSAETPKVNNSKSKRFNVDNNIDISYTPTNGADLYVTDISYYNVTTGEKNGAISVGDQIRWAANGVNAGANTIGSGTKIGVQYQVDGQGYPANTFTWCDSFYGPMQSGEFHEFTANGGTAGGTDGGVWTATNGTHSIMAWIDDSALISESNEDNNRTTKTITVPYAGVQMYSKPDFPDNLDEWQYGPTTNNPEDVIIDYYCSNIKVSDITYEVGTNNTYYFKGIIKNESDGGHMGSGYTQSAKVAFKIDGIVIYQTTLDPIAPNQTEEFNATWEGTVGNHEITVEVVDYPYPYYSWGVPHTNPYELPEDDSMTKSFTVSAIEPTTEEPTQAPKYTVTVDGTVVATVDKGARYTFPTASKIGYYGDGKLYKPGSTYTVNKDVTFSSVKFAAAKTPGLRYTKPAGLSYQGKISCSDASVFNNAITETGVLAVTNDRLGNGAELVLDSKVGYVKFKVTSWLNNVAGSFATSFEGIKDNNYERDFVLRGYMLVNYADGSKATIYTAMTTPVSVSELAYKVFKNKTQYNAMSAANKQLILEYMGIE